MVVSARPRDVKRAQVRASVATLRDRRRAAKRCVLDRRDVEPSAPEHGPPVMKADGTPGELCRACLDRKVELQRERRRRKREGGST